MLEIIDTADAVIVLNNCGIGQGGFQPGNSCAKGGYGSEGSESGPSDYHGIDNPETWAKFNAGIKPTHDLFHVTLASNLESIKKHGLVSGHESDIAQSMLAEPVPTQRVFFTTSPEQASVLASQMRDNGDEPAVIQLRVPSKILAKHDPRVDPGVEESIAIKPSKKFVRDGLLSISTGDAKSVPKDWQERIVANNCGTGAGGFQPGNTCAQGGGGGGADTGGFTGVKGELYKSIKAMKEAHAAYEKAPSAELNKKFNEASAENSEVILEAIGVLGSGEIQGVIDEVNAKIDEDLTPQKSVEELHQEAADKFFKDPTPENKQAWIDAQKAILDKGFVPVESSAKFVTPPDNAKEAPEPITVATTLKTLGGSTGAKLVLGSDGNRYVAKQGNHEAHIKEEYTANKMYEAAGIRVPKVEMIDMDGKPTQLGEFVEGRTLNQLKGAERTKAENELREGFAMDALMGNWDVVGMNADNVMVSDDDGTLVRIDNGGSLRYRAQGAEKTGAQFSDQVGELKTMREKGMAGKIFGELSDAQVAAQIHELHGKRESILAATPDDLKGIISKRLDNMKSWADNHVIVDTGTKPLSEAGVSSSQEFGKSGVYDHTQSKVNPPKSSSDVEHLIKATKGDAVYTELQLAKIAVLNPNGVVDGKFYIAGVANPAHLKGHMDHLKSVLPEGTQILKKHLNAAKVAELLGEDSEVKVPFSVKKKLAEASSKPDGPGVIDHSLGTKIETGYTSHVYAGKGPSTVVEHNGTPYKLTTTSMDSKQSYEVQKWAAKAPQAQKDAIHDWTNGQYGQMRKRIAQGKPNEKDKALLKALDESPNFNGVVYRGIKAYETEGYGAKQMQAIAQAGVGGTWIDDSPMSTSRSPSTGHDFSAGHLLLKIHAKTGTSCETLSIFGKENEVIAKPGVKYRIKNVTKNAKLSFGSYRPKVKMFVELEEI